MHQGRNEPEVATDNPESSEDEHPKMTAQTLAACLLSAAKTYDVPPAVLIGIMQVQGGHIGEEVHLKDGSDVLGPYRISSKYLPELAKLWKVNIETARLWVKDDGCVNAHVSAWILADKTEEAGSLYGGISLYHSESKKEGNKFARKVIAAMDERGLIRHEPLIGTTQEENAKGKPIPIRDVEENH